MDGLGPGRNKIIRLEKGILEKCVDGPMGVGINVPVFMFSINNHQRASSSEALNNQVTQSVDVSQIGLGLRLGLV